MINFIRTTLKTDLSQEKIYEFVSRTLPDFSWRMGDSDLQGLYVTGMKENFGQIQFWIDGDVVDVTVSTRGANLSKYDLENVKEIFFDNVISNVLSDMGEVGQVIKSE